MKTKREIRSRLVSHLGAILLISMIVTACGGSPNPVPSSVTVNSDPFTNRVSQGTDMRRTNLENSRSEVRANSDAASQTGSDPYRNNYYTNPYENLGSTSDTNSEKSNLNLQQYGMFAALIGGLSFLTSDMSPLGLLIGDKKDKTSEEAKDDQAEADQSEDTEPNANALDSTLGQVQPPVDQSDSADGDPIAGRPVFNFEIPIANHSNPTDPLPSDDSTALTFNTNCQIDMSPFHGSLNDGDLNRIFNARNI